MKLGRFYELAVKMGMQKDPRTKEELNNELKRARSDYRRLKGIDREIYDKEKFKHPYTDTRILCGNPNKE
ncbi:MAG: NGG1p interacting factor NIF3, partial [Candidatus Omnitrophica bacterium]|nr:NGG1p interacting factor NIF3 [Candidatus Omnitrophota bacterium]